MFSGAHNNEIDGVQIAETGRCIKAAATHLVIRDNQRSVGQLNAHVDSPVSHS